MRILVNILLLFSFISYSTTISAQNFYEIFIASFSNSRDMKDVHFELYQNDNKLVEQVSKDGTFQFAILENDGNFTLKAWKEDYITKIIHFPTSEYPFINEYEIQDIDIEFRKQTSPDDEPEVGELKWSIIGEVFGVVKYDSTRKEMDENEMKAVEILEEIYLTSVAKGDELIKKEQYDNAKSHFEIALIARQGDEYAIKRLKICKELSVAEPDESTKGLNSHDMEKINQGDLTGIQTVPGEDILFSVQLGAFSKKVNEEKFAGVPDLHIIPYEDYTRVFSGSFKDASEAVEHKKSMVGRGYQDAWIVQMKGNKRIGF